jgi:shikimate dehydrogenase
MDIKGTTRVCGLIGNPVGHSVSPAIHNNLARLTGKDMVYTTFKVEKGDVEAAVRGAYSLNILGLNVTVPHKSEVIDSLVDIDPLAKAIGAVNTLVRADGGFKGYNTDILGLARELEDEGIELADSKVIILGAGGAARAITFLCSSKGAKKIYLLNRSVDKAQDIAYAVNTHFNNEKVIPMNIADYADIPGDDYIVIQTTSVGLHPNDTAVVIDDESFYKKAAVGVDIIYNPAETMFMKLIKAQGKKAYNGLKMLLYQGVSAYELWNDCKISKKEADEVYKCLEKELGINE